MVFGSIELGEIRLDLRLRIRMGEIVASTRDSTKGGRTKGLEILRHAPSYDVVRGGKCIVQIAL